MPLPRLETDTGLRDPSAELSSRRLAQLDELCGMAMEIARDLRDQSAAVTAKCAETQDSTSGPRIAAAFERVARTVRRIAVLEQEIAGLREQRRRNIFRARVGERRQAVRRAVRAAVGSAIRNEDPEIALDDFKERLDNETDYDYDDYDDYCGEDYLQGTLGQLVAQICRDLGVETDPALWDDAGYATGAGSIDTLPAAEEPDTASVLRGKHVFPDPPGVHYDGDEPPERQHAANGHGPPGG